MRICHTIALILTLSVGACASVPKSPAPKPVPTPPIENSEPEPGPAPVPQPTPDQPPTPTPPAPTPIPAAGGFAALEHWQSADPGPALESFKKTCGVWKLRSPDDWLFAGRKFFGTYRDWQDVCEAARQIEPSRENAIRFFQSYFEPVSISPDPGVKPLMTGYYAPELEVRARPEAPFLEPILAKPGDPKNQALPRAKIDASMAEVIAYGRLVDVFFMQVQGSGRLRFPDGHVLRAAFAGHNNRPYVSIGKLMIKRGYLSKDTASKQAIEDWMATAGPQKTREVINSNPRYVFFKSEQIRGDEGPKGAHGVPLTAKGSLAVDTKYYPFGIPIWVETKIPQVGGDYIGKPQGLLLIAQDKGGAIEGKIRGDIFFGVGKQAGDIAGVMKHEAKWSVLLPVALAFKALIG
ncbi:MAG TPA: transglycosylase [Hellea balneolensis]|uniref:peptidoglycan lytic exotransglycosylase n=1 Tax=Hellea balneolensis TaxID=287478 RepID=A0A7C5QST6_9PROT|nr:transglycosylase [Hellea balneolensis]